MIDEVTLTSDKSLDPEAVATQRASAPQEARRKSERRRRAKRTMIIVTMVCLVLGLAPTAEQLTTNGWHAFVDRAPGVGGTPSRPDTAPAPAAHVPAAPGARHINPHRLANRR
jgi:hypothetical protein